MKLDIGGDRLGSGNKMPVDIHEYERSTHDLSYVWRSSMGSGTCVPFMKILGLPGDTHEIELNADALTLPTIGPLFGSYKLQLDVFECPWRLYQGKLHMNMLNIGLDMSAIKLPLMVLDTYWNANLGELQQVNPSSLLSYLGIKGAGKLTATGTTSGAVKRKFNAIGLLAYWDIYKNYYANKQEEVGYVIDTNTVSISSATWTDNSWSGTTVLDVTKATGITTIDETTPVLKITSSGFAGIPIEEIDIDGILFTVNGVELPITYFFDTVYKSTDTIIACVGWQWGYGTLNVVLRNQQVNISGLTLTSFPLANIDTMRQNILADVASASAFEIDETSGDPYQIPFETVTGNFYKTMYSQVGLGIKTYQSDLFNNWISTDWIDGVGGINDITAVSTVGNEFSIDALNLAQKVYVMLNRIAISGGSYDDWLNAVYTHERAKSLESPVYHGSLIKELTFEEVISNAESGSKPLGTLAGRGRLTNKHKGGYMKIKVNEPSYIFGIVSLTPRIDYSQGNDFDNLYRTMDDLHKPALDEIGYQDLVTDQLAWWETETGASDVQVYQSAGKQPAWINYMSAVNKCYGNFADSNKEMFMTLNRRYDFAVTGITDLTTYVDPTKFNQIFADTNLDAQNFWVQIAVKNTARRKMSAKLIPNL